MSEEKEYWQDEHIFEHDGRFVCYDEAGLYLVSTNTRAEAREQLEFYNTYVLNNISTD